MSETTIQPTALHRLLPPATTALERALVEVAAPWSALADAHVDITDHPPAAFAPWLAAEWGLAQFAPYFDGVDALLSAGLPWLMTRGSAASLQSALGWLGYSQATVSEEGPYLQLDVGRIVSQSELAQLRAVVLASIPAHVHFYRIFSGYDDRAIKLSAGPVLGAGLLNRDSGVLIDGSDVLQSFGINTTDTLAPHDAEAFDCTETMASANRVVRPDHMVLSAWRLNTGGMGRHAQSAQAWLNDATPPYPLPASPDQATGQLSFDSIHREPVQPLQSAVMAHTDNTTAFNPKRGWAGAWAGAWVPTFSMAQSTQSSAMPNA